jgi:hypothetical protein
MTPEAREDYERFILSDRPKYIPMKPEEIEVIPRRQTRI